ncbi:MAG: phage holin family protein [Verrucomicrobiota bacterium JB023]|nr:phage holin family protein [Verrucomicrobiota bacterium JB023]
MKSLQNHVPLSDRKPSMDGVTVGQGSRTQPAPARRSSSTPSIKGLIGSLLDDATYLVRQEVELAKTEMAKKASDLGRHTGMIAAAGVIIGGGLVLLLSGLAFGCASLFRNLGVAETSAHLLGFLTMGLVTTVAGGILLKYSKDKLIRDDLKPTKTANQLNETKEWAKEKIS